jgi:molybdenum cofactor synthesis domain-containing protein
MIRAAVVTISDSVAAGTREDRSGPAVHQRVEQLGWTIAASELVPDDRDAISRLLTDLSDQRGVSLIFTTGGTGVAERDVTPEATRAVVDREIPGLAELMRAEGRKSTIRAVLSRGIAGTRGRTLIVNLPGSPRGAVESLEAVARLAPHIIDLLEGRTEHH